MQRAAVLLQSEGVAANLNCRRWRFWSLMTSTGHTRHLKLQEMKISTGWPLILVILLSWGLAFFEYCAQVPANRIGFQGNGGPFNIMQLKVIQEAISLTVFTIVVTFLFKGQPLQWNHLAAFACLILAVFFVFIK